MPPAKKLQVFVSSTYADLREERQAAVEAILSAGHIPAGMELFAAGDESQMSVIRRWIDESDVFLLILGGRYGSLEPLTGKSYIHLEYEYALQRSKPLFAVVIEEGALDRRIRKGGRKNVEIENANQLKEFRELVLSRMVRFWSDHRDIKLAIHETMGEFGRRADLTGWVPADQAVNAGPLAEELARLTKENAELRMKIADAAPIGLTYNGITYDQVVALLQSERIELREGAGTGEDRSEVTLDFKKPHESSPLRIGDVTAQFGDSVPNLIHLLWSLQELRLGAVLATAWDFKYLERLAFFRLIELKHSTGERYWVLFTEDGRRFLLRVMANRVISKSPRPEDNRIPDAG